MFSYHFNLLMSKIIFKNKKNIILICFEIKKTFLKITIATLSNILPQKRFYRRGAEIIDSNYRDLDKLPNHFIYYHLWSCLTLRFKSFFEKN